MRIDFIYGTRPELIKLAIPIRLFRDLPDFTVRVISTGQHKEMLVALEDWFEIAPDFNLEVMVAGQSLAALSARVIARLEDLYVKEGTPDIMVVQGDTTTAFIAGLTGFYRSCMIVHLEAGLRTHNKLSPWPEEMNRVLLSRLSDYHFAPTETSKANLLKEGVDEKSIVVSGNTVIDALYFSVNKIGVRNFYAPVLEEFYTGLFRVNRVVLVTGHRRENFGQGFKSICQAIHELAVKHPDVYFIYPVHMNPQVRQPVLDILGNSLQQNVRLVEPLSYPEFVSLMKRSYLILTDSGGVQEEAPGLGIPVLVMRENTERPEAVMSGCARLVGTDQSTIVDQATLLLTDPETYKQMAKSINPYGDGNASQCLLNVLKSIEKQ